MAEEEEVRHKNEQKRSKRRRRRRRKRRKGKEESKHPIFLTFVTAQFFGFLLSSLSVLSDVLPYLFPSSLDRCCLLLVCCCFYPFIFFLKLSFFLFLPSLPPSLPASLPSPST